MPLPDLEAWLQNHDRDATLSLGHADIHALVGELKRLEQSADRLRKQNNKLRKKVARLKGEDAPDSSVAE